MDQVVSVTIFVVFGLGFVFLNLMVGSLLRPQMPSEEKLAIYECGEPTIGESWVQFDLRFYIVALFYLVFDVEIALIYPWAVVFRDFAQPAVVLGAPFVGLVVLGYAYEWLSGSLEWVRSSVNTSIKGSRVVDVASIARRDPEALADEREMAAHG